MKATHLFVGASAAILLAAGCKKDDGEGDAALTVSPDELGFGDVPVGSSASMDIELSTDAGEVEVLSTSLSSGDESVWRVVRGSRNTVTASSDVTVTVTFTPENETAYTGIVQIRTTDPVLDNLQVSVSGSGAASESDEDGDGVTPAEGDCDDDNADVYPGAAERCDGVDNDCDGDTPSDEADSDSDGVRVCDGDCDDGDGNVYPGAPEICDDKDSDCVGGNNDFADVDGDGHAVCVSTTDLTLDDCDDGNEDVFVGNTEVCGDSLDNDCNGSIDDIDVDQDGHSLCSASGDCDDTDPNAFPVVVSTSGSSSGAGTDDSPYDTLTTALANLDQVCREVRVQPGSYTVAQTISGEDVRIVGQGSIPADTTLTADTDARHFRVDSGGTLELENLTLTGGAPVAGGGGTNVDGGAILVDGAFLQLEDVVLSGNASTTDGGALAAQGGADVQLSVGVVFQGNNAGDNGGAVALNESTYTDDLGTTYESNGSGAFGGAIRAEGGALTVAEATFLGNVAGDDGGAASLNASGDYILERNEVWLNVGTRGGGFALDGIGGSTGTIRNNFVQDNTSTASSGVGGGGILLVGDSTGADLEIVNNSLTGNVTGGDGGGLYLGGSSASGVIVWANIVYDSDGATGIYVDGSGVDLQYNTASLTNTNVDFGGDAQVDVDGNNDDDPLFQIYSSDNDPTNDTLLLQPSSTMIDTGPPGSAFEDAAGNPNDRGAYGGPGAP